MKIFSTTQLTRSTMALLEAAQCEPIMITRYGKPRFVLMSHEHFETMQLKLDHANESEQSEALR